MVSPLQAIIGSILQLSGSNCQRFYFYKISTYYDHLCFYVGKNIFSFLPLTINLTADHKNNLPRFQPITNILFSRQLMYRTSHIPCKEMNSKMLLQTSRKL